ncbi:MAG: hypothetical protein KC501_05720 [Myxococcales bacterium]|nr:hypothetical protein [Myxococcales bacterium]
MHPRASSAWRAVALGPLLGLAGALAWGASPAASMPDVVTIPVAREHPGGMPAHAASFRHGTHRRFSCFACHPGLFPKYPLGFTHDDMRAGQYCGGCHDGRVASGIPEQPCERCHAAH